MPPVTVTQIDAFTDHPFSGNPAGVVLLDEPADERWMQAIAAEVNLSETAFLVPRDDGWDLRWFTPQTEVALCGHATLAAAFHLVADRDLDDEVLRFHTKSGLLEARPLGDDRIEIDLPADPAEPVDAPDGLLDALGLREVVAVARGRTDLLVAVAEPHIVRSLDPDLRALAQVPARGVVVTAPCEGCTDIDADIVSRFFAPAVGVDEDPVTGSAHCMLGPWWAEILGRDDLVAYQASARGGTLQVAVRGDRVVLQGGAVHALDRR